MSRSTESRRGKGGLWVALGGAAVGCVTLLLIAWPKQQPQEPTRNAEEAAEIGESHETPRGATDDRRRDTDDAQAPGGASAASIGAASTGETPQGSPAGPQTPPATGPAVLPTPPRDPARTRPSEIEDEGTGVVVREPTAR